MLSVLQQQRIKTNVEKILRHFIFGDGISVYVDHIKPDDYIDAWVVYYYIETYSEKWGFIYERQCIRITTDKANELTDN